MLLVFHSVGDAIRAAATHPVPKKALVEFARVRVARGAAETIAFELDTAKALSLVNAAGNRVVYPGEHALLFDAGDESKPVEIKITV